MGSRSAPNLRDDAKHFSGRQCHLLLWQVLHIQEFLRQAPRSPICAKALHRRAMARRVSGGGGRPDLDIS